MSLSIKLSSISLTTAEGCAVAPEGTEGKETVGVGPDPVISLDVVELASCCLFPNACSRFCTPGRCPHEKDTCVEWNASRHAQLVFSI